MKKDAYTLLSDFLVALHDHTKGVDDEINRSFTNSIEDIATKHKLKITPKDTK